jgi:hypothetical protein
MNKLTFFTLAALLLAPLATLHAAESGTDKDGFVPLFDARH